MLPNSNIRFPRIAVFAGPKGGIGRSTLTAEFARCFAQHEQKVLLIEFDSIRQGLHFILKFQRQAVQDTQNFAPAPTGKENIDVALLHIEAEDIPVFYTRLRRTQGYDWVLIDLSSEFSPRDAACFLDADLPILISTPDEASIFASTQWLRFCVEQSLLRQPSTQSLAARLEAENHAEGWFYRPFYNQLSPEDREFFKSAVTNLHAAFILNQRREGSESQQSESLCHAWSILIGPLLSSIGTITFEDRRWFYTRGFAPGISFAREESILADIEIIVRNLLKTWPLPTMPSPCLPLVDPSVQPRTFLLSLSAAEARLSYRKLWEGYRRENGLISMVMTPEQISDTVRDLETALKHSTLEESQAQQQPVLTASQEMRAVEPMSRKLSGTFSAVSSWSPSECRPNPGSILQTRREALGLTPRELSLQTRIPVKQLENLEHSQLDNLPAAYLRAYLFELSKALDIPLEDLHRAFGFDH